MTRLEYESVLRLLGLEEPPKHHSKKRFEQRRLVERVYTLAHSEGMKDARMIDANRESVLEIISEGLA